MEDTDIFLGHVYMVAHWVVSWHRMSTAMPMHVASRHMAAAEVMAGEAKRVVSKV